MKTQFMILTAGLILAGFIGCHEENKAPIQIQSSPTDVKMEGLDTLSHNDVKYLLDSLSAIEIMPLGTMN